MVPNFYERVRRQAETNWTKHGSDRAWHIVFKQIQHPRLVISELLQNADDAGAKNISVYIDNGAFIFEHDGNDFTESQFRDLCDFCSSNKKTMHTIGCWGIGFKSTFSIGDCVELFSPTISVCFHRDRFIIPCRITKKQNTNGKTRFVVAIKDKHRERAIKNSFKEWKNNPIPLLFFKNILKLKVEELEIHRSILKPGPIPDSEWMRLEGDNNDDYLLFRTEKRDFEMQVLKELEEEWGVSMDCNEDDIPPFKIDIVMGAQGMLYTVLPTGVGTALPFACNAPFITDPARLGIKEPEISPTNTWLLECAGKLAASAMLSWLENNDEQPDIRVRAYDLFTNVDQTDTKLHGICGTIVENAFAEKIEGRPLLLTEERNLVKKKKSIALPIGTHNIWPLTTAAYFFDNKRRPALCQHISSANRKKLLRWDLVEEIDERAFLKCLVNKQPLRPKSEASLLKLWSYVERLSIRHSSYFEPKDIYIVPVQGEDNLYASSDVARYEMEDLQTERDKELITRHLNLLDQKWADYLTLENEKMPKKNQELTMYQKDVGAALSILRKIGLISTSSSSKVINMAAERLFADGNICIAQSVQLAHIAAKINATISEAFCYYTQESRLHSSGKGIYFDKDDSLIKLLPDEGEHEAMFLHQDYIKEFLSCSNDEWDDWIDSGKAGLLTFIPLKKYTIKIHGEPKIRDEARRRLYFGPLVTDNFKTEDYIVEDWDFDQHCWEHWNVLAVSDEQFWTELVKHLLKQPKSFWEKSNSARLLQESTGYTKKLLTENQVLPTWVLRLRDLPCLSDKNGKSSKPCDLYRTTKETACLSVTEAFVSQQLDDGDRTAPIFDLLGVQNKPPGPERLLEILQEHSTKPVPNVSRVEGLYHALNQQLFDGDCSDKTILEIKKTFQTEKLVLTQHGNWAAAPYVFISSHEVDFDVEVIRETVKELKMWNTFEVPDRPTSRYAVELLQKLPNKQLEREETRHIRLYLKAFPVEIWQQCEHWINLEGEWGPVDSLSYSLTKKHIADYNHIHPWVKQKTADLRDLSDKAINNQPFSELKPLNMTLEKRLHPGLKRVGNPIEMEWMTACGKELCRIELDTEDKTQHVRVLAKRLAQTKVHKISNLKTVPYLNGECAGETQSVDVFWSDKVLNVSNDISKAQLAKSIPNELGNTFGNREIENALYYCYDRSVQDIRDYLEENFQLCKESVYFVDDGEMTVVEDETVRENSESVDMKVLPKAEHDEKGGFLDSTDITPGDGQHVGNNAKKPSLGNRQSRHSSPKPRSSDQKRQSGAISPRELSTGEERYRQTKERPGQGYFREGLMVAYGGKCAISGCNVGEVLVAAHICPVKDGGSDEISNGLLLRADLHMLFDRGLIAIDSNKMKVLVHKKLLKSEYGSFEGKSMWIPNDPSLQPSKELLDRHKQQTF